MPECHHFTGCREVGPLVSTFNPAIGTVRAIITGLPQPFCHTLPSNRATLRRFILPYTVTWHVTTTELQVLEQRTPCIWIAWLGRITLDFMMSMIIHRLLVYMNSCSYHINPQPPPPTTTLVRPRQTIDDAIGLTTGCNRIISYFLTLGGNTS